MTTTQARKQRAQHMERQSLKADHSLILEELPPRCWCSAWQPWVMADDQGAMVEWCCQICGRSYYVAKLVSGRRR